MGPSCVGNWRQFGLPNWGPVEVPWGVGSTIVHVMRPISDRGLTGLGVLQHMDITLDGLIWDLGIFNYGFGYV